MWDPKYSQYSIIHSHIFSILRMSEYARMILSLRELWSEGSNA